MQRTNCSGVRKRMPATAATTAEAPSCHHRSARITPIWEGGGGREEASSQDVIYRDIV